MNIEESYKEEIISQLDHSKGAYLCSSFEYPGRYSRWDLGFYNPPIEIRGHFRNFEIEALNEKGMLLLTFIKDLLEDQTYFKTFEYSSTLISGEIIQESGLFTEENRSRQASIFSLLRTLIQGFYDSKEEFLGFYGSFGFDLIFQFEPIELAKERRIEDKDIILFLPDELFIMDHRKERPFILQYDFTYKGKSTEGLSREPFTKATTSNVKVPLKNPIPGTYAKSVTEVKESFRKGDLLKSFPLKCFKEKQRKPKHLVSRLLKINPSPYGFLVNMGEEILIGASPEMYVRVEDGLLETCPISGTIKRGKTPIEDAEQIKTILNSEKEESELTMCSDVDRNDKSRVCVQAPLKF